jgi:hypothetical protein
MEYDLNIIIIISQIIIVVVAVSTDKHNQGVSVLYRGSVYLNVKSGIERSSERIIGTIGRTLPTDWI